MNPAILQPCIDFNFNWHLPAHFYSPMNNTVFRVCVFAEAEFEPLETMIREMIADRPTEPESVLVRVEAGVTLELLKQLRALVSELLPDVDVCFESGYTKDMLYGFRHHARKMKEYYKALAN